MTSSCVVQKQCLRWFNLKNHCKKISPFWDRSHMAVCLWSEHINNLLHVIFSEGTKHIFYVIPPQWHDTGSWNPFSSKTSTVYWCIASKLKAPRNFYWMSNMFLWVEIFIFFVCYHVVPKRHSQLDYELNGLWNKIKLKTTRWRWCFLKIFTMTMSLESFDQLV